MSHDEKERELQNRIFESPSLLPGFDEPAATAKEVRVRRAGMADVVVVDAEGQIAIVECKRAINPQLRRWVIGQVFEYAAGLWKLDYEDFNCLLAARGTVLTKPFEGAPGWEKETFRRNVSRNLEAADFRLFIAVNEMTEKLKRRLDRTVVFLNSRMPEVQLLAVELPSKGGREVYGDEDPETIGPLPPRLKPDRCTLITGISSPDAACAAEGLLDWAERKDLTVGYAPRKQDGTETAVIHMPDGYTLFRIRQQREVRVSFRGLRKHHWDEERISRLVQDLAKIDARFDTKSKGDRPIAPLKSLAQKSKREAFLALMEQVLKTLAG